MIIRLISLSIVNIDNSENETSKLLYTQKEKSFKIKQASQTKNLVDIIL